jgi:putative transposase
VKKDYQKNAASATTPALPQAVTVALAELAGDVQEGLLAMAVGTGLQVMAAMMSADLEAACGPRGKHDPTRTAVRHGSEAGSVTLGGRRLPVARPRMRAADGSGELAVASYELFSRTEVLGWMAMERMPAGLSTRRYPAGLEPVGQRVEQAGRSTSKSAVSRRFVAATETALGELLAADLSELDLVALMIDGVHFGEHVCVVALGIGIDGGKALRAAVTRVFEHPVIQHCQLHKIRNVADKLPDHLASTVTKRMRAAYRADSALAAEAQLDALAKELERTHPGAAGSLREGLAETLTVLRLGVAPTLARTLRSTNSIESMISIARTHSSNVKNWQNGTMALRWCAAGMIEAGKQFRRVNGHLHLPGLRVALDAYVAAQTVGAIRHDEPVIAA